MEQNKTYKRDKNVWVFNAGNNFSGNPKWLFMYIVNHKEDIKPYWLCYKKETQEYVRKLGYQAYMYNSKKGKEIEKKAGVYVVDQVKERIEDELVGITILNLWHGVGCKSIERKVDYGFLEHRIAKKYIQNNQTYKNSMLFLVTSPLMEDHFKKQVGLDDSMIIRGGYPNCIGIDKVVTYDHDIRKQKGLSADTKIAMYSPTYRDANAKDFFGKAVPDMDALITRLKDNNMLLIFKMHPLMEGDFQYNQYKKYYKDCPYLLFWDNSNDIYEIFDQIDLGIIDYSSIFYDMLAAGVKHFVRYIFDYEDKNNVRDFVFDLKEMTCGKVCESFEDLLDSFSVYEQEEDSADQMRIYDLFWKYRNDNSMEEIIQRAMDFEPDMERELPILYSFDIFDTVFRRKCLKPEGIFYYVAEKMIDSNLRFPFYLLHNYPDVRKWCEANVREFYKKSVDLRKDIRLEITFDEIFDRMKDLYELSDVQVEALKEWELEAEYDNCYPFPQQLNILKELVDNGETVILISDMYLPKGFIQKMLDKVDPILTTLPLFLSSELGVQKTTNKLFLKAYHEMDFNNFGKWIHYGDNKFADRKKPKQLGIEPIRHAIPGFVSYEWDIVKACRSYDSYLVSGLLSRFRNEHIENMSARYTYSYVSLYFVPYVHWAIKHALKKEIKCLYFISRDGHFLKKIADEIIQTRNYNIKTKYIYGSRKAWRIPSFITKIDNEFFGPFGNFTKLKNFNMLLQAADIDEATFDEIFPELEYLKTKENYKKADLDVIKQSLKNSEKYHETLLKVAADERKIVLEYLKQEIDINEKFAFIEYWGRGYTQDCLTRLLTELNQGELDNPFYYIRSIYPTMGNSIRYNFTSDNTSLIFIEAIFANLPYRSIEKYEYKDGKFEAVKRPCENDIEIYEAFEEYLPKFSKDFCEIHFLNEDAIERSLFDFSLKYFKENVDDEVIVNNIAHLKDSVELHGKVGEYAPKITANTLVKRFQGEKVATRSMDMSLARSKKIYSFMYYFYHNRILKTKAGKKFKRYLDSKR